MQFEELQKGEERVAEGRWAAIAIMLLIYESF
jgi:hypothetical protein